jgi:hypothetical protein
LSIPDQTYQKILFVHTDLRKVTANAVIFPHFWNVISEKRSAFRFAQCRVFSWASSGKALEALVDMAGYPEERDNSENTAPLAFDSDSDDDDDDNDEGWKRQNPVWKYEV